MAPPPLPVVMSGPAWFDIESVAALTDGSLAAVSVAGLIVRLLAALTVSVYAWLPVKLVLLASVALIVNEDEPVVVGVPLSTPVVELSDNQDGRVPALTAKV